MPRDSDHVLIQARIGGTKIVFNGFPKARGAKKNQLFSFCNLKKYIFSFLFYFTPHPLNPLFFFRDNSCYILRELTYALTWGKDSAKDRAKYVGGFSAQR